MSVILCTSMSAKCDQGGHGKSEWTYTHIHTCMYVCMYIDIKEMERAFVVLMKRHNLTPLSIPREEVSWYSDYSGMTDEEPNDIGVSFKLRQD